MSKSNKKNKSTSQMAMQRRSDAVTCEVDGIIDSETVKLKYIQNGEVKDVRQYIIRTRYENDKNQLESQIQTLQKQIDENCKLREALDMQITKLRNDKNILEQKIKKLDDDNHLLKDECDVFRNKLGIFEKDNRILMEDNKRLGTRVSELEKHFERLHHERTMHSLIVAIQDVNSIHHLEQLATPECAQSLSELRNQRNDESHYIFWNKNNDSHCKSDSDIIENFKKKKLLEKINCPEMKRQIDELNDDYGDGFIDEIGTLISQCVDPNKPDPPKREQKIIMRYWND